MSLTAGGAIPSLHGTGLQTLGQMRNGNLPSPVLAAEQICSATVAAGPAILMRLALTSRGVRDYAVRGRRMPKKLTPSGQPPEAI